MKNKSINSVIYSYKINLSSLEDTFFVAKNIGLLLQKTSIRLLLLYGALGAGKTSFSRGFVSAFENATSAEVSSPTFTLVNHYPTLPPIIHADIYRLAEMVDCSIDDLDEEFFPQLNLPDEIDEFLYDSTNNSDFLLVEWADFLDTRELTKERLDIFLEISNNNRSLSLYVYTNQAKACLQELEKLVASYRNN